MAEPFDSHFVNADQPGSLRVIARAATNIAAFVGRALKGPVNEPVPVRSFADYARVLLGLPLGFLIVQLGRFPAGWVLVAWFVMQLLMGGMNATRPAGAEGGVAFGAHIGGFVAGLLLVTLFKRRNVPLWRAY